MEAATTWLTLLLFVQTLPTGTRIGLDSTLFSITELKTLRASLEKAQQDIILLEENLIDKIWQDRPPSSKEPLDLHAKYAGEASTSKFDKVRSIIKSKKASAYAVHEMSEIAWLLNLRGKDIPFSPVFEAYLLVTLESASLFLDRDKVTEEVAKYLKDELNTEVQPYEGIWEALKVIQNAKQSVCALLSLPETLPDV